ncbi:hypothetical protein BDN71DRAFT_1397353 [Pleurotus eryngii]|uniref:Uncharacterized protein n=1 Tax=Pleurotus eryngii TaxID=5323 RepID=A0A9P6D5L9_PLEER|nr:hypothetical protein BDN71DRAFT_1397353 [Pleurotus eryngii]
MQRTYGTVHSSRLHFSVGVLFDDAEGMYHTDTIWNDADPAQITTIAPDRPHREVDLLIVNAGKEGYVRTYIVLPSTIYGLAQGPLIDPGVSNNRSIQIPSIVEASLARKQGGMVGQAQHQSKHYTTEPDLFIIIYDAALNKPETGHATNGFYFGEWSTLLVRCRQGGLEAPVQHGFGGPEPTTLTKKEIDKYLGGIQILKNPSCRVFTWVAIRHSRSRNPKKGTVDMFASIRAEVEEQLKASGQAPSS